MNREFRMSMAKIWNEDGCSRHTAECMAAHEAGLGVVIIKEGSPEQSRVERVCPPDCGGCSCHFNPPCSHCVEHFSEGS
jgi:hypothetical protein